MKTSFLIMNLASIIESQGDLKVEVFIEDENTNVSGVAEITSIETFNGKILINTGIIK